MSAPQAIAWLDTPAGGVWGDPDSLALPLSDRGLLLADGLFETVLLQAGRPQLLAAHLRRWHSSAALLGMPPPPSLEAVAARAAEAVARSGIKDGALRLNWSRGSQAPGQRGLEPPQPARARFWLQLTPATASFASRSVLISRHEQRNASSLLSRCKTFAYGQAIAARREAREAGFDDALLASSAGGLCCGSAANLLLYSRGRWLTPPLSSGCLPGVMRGRALELGLALEQPLSADKLLAGDGAVLLNSLGCQPIRQLQGQPLPPPPEPEDFWRALLREPVPPEPKLQPVRS